MTKQEKIAFLICKDTSLWLTTRAQVERELSDGQQLFCCCGRLATGLHEHNCRKFQDKVDSQTVKKLWKNGYKQEVS